MITYSRLNRFCGSYRLHKHWSNAFTYTDGVKFLADRAKAHWLLYLIGSHQAQLLSDPVLQSLQIWTLKVKERNGVLTCERDSETVVVTQHIENIDFPLPQISLFLVSGVLLLPSEY